MKNPRQLKLVGLDPSLRNWGISVGLYTPETGDLKISNLWVINAVLPTGKQVRQNSKDVEAATQLYAGTVGYLTDADAIFVEVPVGSQSARSMASYGICAGVLGGLRATGFPFFELTPTEVKLAGAGIKTATKQQMIDWAIKAHPEARWPTYKEHGQELISEAKAEHLADATAAIHAGIKNQQFKQLLAMTG